jgi:serine/threonine-protein kinase
MFGSTRFMAPEEFELGAPIDQRTNVFVMGRTALLFLSDGTREPGAFRGSPALFKVAARACEPDRADRYDSLASFYAAWRAAQNTEHKDGNPEP